ncbi:MAG: Oxygen-independent coproporphyrinogen-III oxidase-like protein [Acidobacteria bacterium]|jgi:oxygen-independent coproporphyrinogen-3 oxidase|nr:Oxygen-independent coproporphyrinogen-III oxidase-like protein [Acidobacteriota bacterium]
MSAGIYLHIPFCRSRCSYCDFATDVFKSDAVVERYVSALVKEIENFSQTAQSIDTIYFGGGTPSLLAPGQLEKILNSIYKKFPLVENLELTMEMNPATVTPETLNSYKSLGVNRASFGAQTFDDTELKRLGRRHTANDVRETIELLRNAGFDNVSFDLIAGLPRQTLADWERNLDEALELNPEHLSLYLLEIHEGTPLAEQIRSRRQPLPDEDLPGEMYELMLEKTARKGYEQYEISNFSLPGFQSKHNTKYWLCEPVYAFGVSAHSFDGKHRYANERDTAKYVDLIESSSGAEVYREETDLGSEFVFLGLRLSEGIDLGEYEKRFGANLREKYAADLRRLEEFGLIEFAGNNLRLTRKGMVYSNEVFSVFV